MTLPYKFLNIDPHILSDKIYSYTLANTDVLTAKRFWTKLDVSNVMSNIPEIKQVFDNYGLIVNNVSVIYIDKAWDFGLLHSDWNPERNDGKCAIRVVWPVYNCQKSRNEFYEVDRNKQTYQNIDPWGACLSFNKNDIISTIDSFTLTQPMFFDSNCPHGIYIDSDIDYRLTATFGFDNPPSSISAI